MKKFYILVLFAGMMTLNGMTQNQQVINLDWSNNCVTSGLLTSLAGDTAGDIWLGSYFKIIRTQGNQCTMFNNVPNYSTSITFDHNNVPYAVASMYLLKFNGISWDTVLMDNKLLNGKLKFDDNDSLWIAANSSLFKYNGISLDTFAIPSNLTTYSNEWTREFCIDHTGNKWICNTWAKGIYKFDGSQWSKYSPNSFVISSTLDTAGNVWYNDSSGFIRYDGQNFTKYDTSNSCLPAGIDYNTARIVAEDDFIWIVDIFNDRIIRFKPGSCTTYDTLGFQGTNGFSVGELYNGDNLYILLDSVGISIFGKGDVNNINGYVFNDADSNGLWGPTEYAMPNQVVYLEPNNVLVYTDASGHYSVDLWAPYGNYKLSHHAGNYYIVTTADTLYITQTHTDEVTDSVNFGKKITMLAKDMEVSITANNFRAGQQANYWVSLLNSGTLNIDSGYVTLGYDDTLHYTSSIPQADTLQPGHLSWKFYNLTPQELRNFKVELYVDTFIFIGTNLQATAVAYPVTGDYVPANNYFTIEHATTGPLDPNDKQVLPKGFGTNGYISNDDSLTYTIRFQNVGNDTAFKVRIEDGLSSHFDISSFKVTGTSHPCHYNINLQNNKLTVYFPHINLPDSNVNQSASCGFFKYRLNLKPALPDNTQIYNYAYIFFDYNFPEYTNFVLNTVNNLITAEPQQKFSKDIIHIYPNPAFDELYIEFPGPLADVCLISLYNILGEEVKSITIAGGSKKIKLEMASLNPGLYICRIISGGEVLDIIKILKTR